MKRETLEKHLLAIQAKLEEAKEVSVYFGEIEESITDIRDNLDALEDRVEAAKESGDVTYIEEADALVEEVFSELRHEENLEGSGKCVTEIVMDTWEKSDATHL